MWELDCEEGWALKNWCFWTVVLEKTLESPLDCKEVQLVHPKGDQSWVFIGRTDAKAETPVLWLPHAKIWLIGKDWCWEGLGAGGEGDDRGWDGWMASPTRWTWVWVNSGSWCWTGRPGVLQFMTSQRAGHNWATELNWTEAQSWAEHRHHVISSPQPPYRQVQLSFTQLGNNGVKRPTLAHHGAYTFNPNPSTLVFSSLSYSFLEVLQHGSWLQLHDFIY